MSEVENLERVKDTDDIEAIKHAMETVNKASHKMAEELYKQASAQAGDGAAGEGEGAQAGPTPGAPGGQAQPEDASPGGEDVIDADYEVKE